MRTILISAAAILMAGTASAAPTTKAGDFVKMAGAGDLFEKTSSQLVLKDAKNPKVRDFADMMIKDHTKSTADVVAAAKADGLRPGAPKLMPAQTKMISELKAAKPADREKLYLKQQVTAHQQALGIGEIRRFEGLNPAMLDLASGRIDGYISDIPALQYYTKDKPSLKVVERIPTGEKYSIMFAKDSPLVTQVNDVLTALKKEGYIAALHEKWFGAKAEDTTSTVQVADIPKAK